MVETRVASILPATTSRRRSPKTRYLYAIVATPTPVPLDVAGVAHDDELRMVCHRGLGAVISSTDHGDYKQMTRQEALRYLVAHQRVLEAVMGQFTVLPVRFGTVLPDESAIRRLLEQGHTLFSCKLDEFSGYCQMEVVVTWRLADVLREIAADEGIIRAKQQAATQPPPHAEDARIAVGRMVKAALDQRRIELRDRLLPRLRDVAVDLVVNVLLDDSMVLNVALLLDPAGPKALDHRLAELDREFQGLLDFRCVGPLPPYSFAAVTVGVPNFEMVDAARRQLRLRHRATPAEIKQAYRALAAQEHPDVNQGGEAGPQMAALNDAYRLLTAYAGGPPGDGKGTEPMVGFDQASVARRLLISIVRQEAFSYGE